MVTSAHTELSSNGRIRTWSAAGPFATPLKNMESLLDGSGWAYAPLGRAFLSNVPQSLAHKEVLYERLDLCTAGAVEYLDRSTPPAGDWYPVETDEQGVIDFGLFAFAPIHLRSWLSGWIEVDQSMVLTVQSPAVGPTVLYVDGTVCGTYNDFGYVEPKSAEWTISISPGLHSFVLGGDMLVWREARLTMGLTVVSVQTEDGGSGVISYSPVDPRVAGSSRREEGTPSATARALQTVIQSLPAKDRRLIATPAEILGIVGETDEPDFRMEPYGSRADRSREALLFLAGKDDSPVSDSARVVLGQQKELSDTAIDAACTHLERRFDCADFFAVWMHIVLHLDDERKCLSPAHRSRIETSLQRFKYRIEESGIDAMCFFTENHQLIFYTAGYLSGIRFPDDKFSGYGSAGAGSPVPGQTGRRLAAHSRESLMDWISRKLSGGFSEWDSSAYLAMDVYALLALVEYARDEKLIEAARGLLDDIFYRIALHSWKGIHGSTHGRCYVNSLLSGRFDGTSGLQRIAWGLGGFEGEHWAILMFALSLNYEVPRTVIEAAVDLSGTRENRVYSHGRYNFREDLRDDFWSVHTVTRKTDTYMLSAALDQRPGTPGNQEHLWQATLGREAIVFTNYPANTALTGHARPNFWAGSARLPRVWMYGRTVISLYDLVPTVGLGRTHAHFPVKEFSQWGVDGPWAKARLDDAFVMLWSDGDLSLAGNGPGVGRELLSTSGRVWICWVGSAYEDGSFDRFVSRVQADPPRLKGSGVVCTDPDGSSMELQRHGPCIVDGRVQSLWNSPVITRDIPDKPYTIKDVLL